LFEVLVSCLLLYFNLNKLKQKTPGFRRGF